MPVITLQYDDLEKLTGTDKETFIKRVPMIGADIERIEDEYIDILREAVSARNGWKRILERCSPRKPTHRG